MRTNLIAFGLLALVLIVEGWVFGPLIWEATMRPPGECNGYTTYYHDTWSSYRIDCTGVRHPDDQVDVQVPTPTAQDYSAGDLPAERDHDFEREYPVVRNPEDYSR